MSVKLYVFEVVVIIKTPHIFIRHSQVHECFSSKLIFRLMHYFPFFSSSFTSKVVSRNIAFRFMVAEKINCFVYFDDTKRAPVFVMFTKAEVILPEINFQTVSGKNKVPT